MMTKLILTSLSSCNGAPGDPGPPGPPGDDGEDGLNTLTDINLEPPGPNCTNGGFRFDV